MDRKGIHMMTVVVLIVFLFVFTVLFVLYRKFIAAGEEVGGKNQCQASLLATRAADLKVMCVKAIANPIPLHCPREFLTVAEDDVRTPVRGKDESIKYRYDSVCPDTDPSFRPARTGACLAHNVIAEEMRECWSTFFEGKSVVFQQVEVQAANLFAKKQHAKACHVCAEVTLKTGKDVTGFKGYLQHKQLNITAWDRNAPGSYFEYLAQQRQALCNPDVKGSTTCWEGFASDQGLDQDTLKDGTTYAIVFVRQGMSTCSKDDPAEDIDKVPTMTVQAIPAADIARHCDTVIV